MNADELDQRLLELGIEDVRRGTLRSWASQRVITGPERYFEHKPGGQGRYVGRKANWPEETVEDVVAYFAVKKWQLQQPRQRGTKLMPLLPFMPKLRKFAKEWYESPFIAAGLKGMVSDNLRAHLASVGVHCYVVHFEWPFLMEWLMAVQKVRHKWPMDKPATVHFIWPIDAEIYKPAVTLEEAIRLHLPPMRPKELVYTSESGEDELVYSGKMYIEEQER